MGKNKGRHFDASKRAVLANMLARRAKAKDVAAALGMDPTSVSREIARNRIRKAGDPSEEGSPCSGCANRLSCKIRHACGRMSCSIRCAGCAQTEGCRSFSRFSCPVATRYPLCCNGCAKEARCPLPHYYYYPDDAQAKSRDRLVSSRSGMDLTEEEFRAFDDLVYEAVVVKGQSVHHLVASCRDRLGCSEKTVYRRIDSGMLRAKPVDLPRKAGLKKRKRSAKYEYVHAGDLDRTGHLWPDWLVHQVAQGVVYHWEMDFLGKPNASRKEVLALALPNFKFALLYLFEGSTQEGVKALFDRLETELGPALFRKVFPAVITDRDVAFDDFASLEGSADGTVRTRVFYADPGASNQKPSVENYNQQLRAAIPKKAILDDCDQSDLTLLACHMNSRRLASLSDRTPASLFAAAFGDEALERLGIREIPPSEVRLKPIAK